MQIDHQIAPVVIHGDASIVHTLAKISKNRAGLIYCVSPHGVLEGVLSDGDFRRWIVDQPEIDLERPVISIANRNFVSARVDEPSEAIARLFSPRIASVPLLDKLGRLQAVAWPSSREVRIGDHLLGPGQPVFVVAEIGNNHNGSIDAARRLVDAAAAAGVDAVKFQMRDLASLYVNGGDATDQAADLGEQYTLDLLARFQLEDDALFRVFDHCRDRGVLPLCTPWDLHSLDRLETVDLPAYKIASADLTNHELIEAACGTGRPLVLSTGMSTEDEIVETVHLLQGRGAPFAVLHCNSSYPAPFHDVNLAYMDRLTELGDFPVGYSGHERGISVAVGAVARGAQLIEKHLTLDRDQEGNDHVVSLLPHEMRAMVDAIREVEQAVGSRRPRLPSQGELMNREILAKSLVARVPIPEGTVIEDHMVEAKSPGRGLQPNHRADLVGRRAQRTVAAGGAFYPQDLGDERVEPRPFAFRRPWGLPVRYHDWDELTAQTNPTLLEIHLSYRDLELDGPTYFPEPLDLDLVVHAPELFAGDHLLDLTAPDDDYRSRSVAELQRVVDLTRALRPRFANAEAPLIVVNVGGFSFDGPLEAAEMAVRRERLAESLERIDEDGVELIPQTMPPFPWHMGGQRFHNLLVDDEEIAKFCAEHERRICLDVSHSKLACNHAGRSFDEFVRRVAPYTAHLHLADARGVDGEGIQVGEGGIDFGALADALNACPEASFIPEVWQGHKDDGAGFWVALDRLENWF